MIRYTSKNLFAFLCLTAFGCFLLTALIGSVFDDVLESTIFYLPIFSGAAVASTFWFWLCRPQRSLLGSFLVTALGALIGNICWPSGVILAYLLTDNALPSENPWNILFASLTTAMVTGGVIGCILNIGFSSSSSKSSGGIVG